MTVASVMANGHETTCGGYMSLLANTTPACDRRAAGGGIDFVDRAYEGDVLVGSAEERTRTAAASAT
ncbi:hypothetical protein [Streptomyces sp. 378]|uniref:hypothetical protein n=1 Tax=Streptomyces sp. 378 TaxID=3049412 RepID=UPI0032E35E7A